MAKTAQNLIDLFRQAVDDTVSPYLWSDIEVLSYIDEAQHAFARETNIFFDSVTPGLTSIAVGAKQTFVPLDPRILRVRRAKLTSQTNPLKVLNLDELDPSWDWEAATGTPRILVLDDSVELARLVPISQIADTLSLQVYRDPLNSVSDVTDILEVNDPIDLRQGLLNYMKGAAYDKNDSDIHNEALSLAGYKAFKAYALGVKYRYQKQRRVPGPVRYGGL